MSIEIGSRWVKDGKVVEVTNFYESVSIWCIWFIDSKTISHILTERDFLEQYKPYEPVYEWQWAYITNSLLNWHTSNYMTEEEFKTWQGSANNSLVYQRLDITKRERK